jgi:hypothetical protein
MRLMTLAVQRFTNIALRFFATLLVTIMMMDVYSRVDTLYSSRFLFTDRKLEGSL